MITISSRVRSAVALRPWIALALFAALAVAAAGCGDKKSGSQDDKNGPAFKYEKPPDYDRPLNEAELDSMRAMKITHHVSRDEYWDETGGVLASDRFEVWYGNRKIYVIQAMAVLKLMDQAADRANKTFGRIPSERLVVVCAPTMDAFRKATGRDWWQYSLIKGDTLSFQTPMTLFMRQLLNTAAQREYYMWVLGKLTAGKAPRWLLTGMASYLAGERDVLVGQRKEYATQDLRMDVKDIEKTLTGDNDRIPVRRATYNAYLMVSQLVQDRGMPAVASFVLAFATEPTPEEAAQRAFSQTYEEVLTGAGAWTEPVATTTSP